VLSVSVLGAVQAKSLVDRGQGKVLQCLASVQQVLQEGVGVAVQAQSPVTTGTKKEVESVPSTSAPQGVGACEGGG
jgi:hypothetical protein